MAKGKVEASMKMPKVKGMGKIKPVKPMKMMKRSKRGS